MSKFVLMNIDMTLDPQSIQEAIKRVNFLKEKLATGLQELARMLTEDRGPRIAQMYIAQFPAVDTGALHDSMFGEYDSGTHTGHVKANVPYAVYVEFGTGIVGEDNPHPQKEELGIEYPAAEKYGMAGWWYPSEDGWYTPKDSTVKLAWTMGMPARPFMYNTLRELELEAEREGGQIIAKYIP